MNRKLFVAMWAVILSAGTAQAVDVLVGTTTQMVVSSATIAEASTISPGRYVVSVAPNFDGAMADRLEKAVGKLPGFKSVKARTSDSTLSFTVKEGSQIKLAELQKVVGNTHNRAVISNPRLEGAQTAVPGI